MELQEAVRWTEMLRASKYDQLLQNKQGLLKKSKRDFSLFFK